MKGTPCQIWPSFPQRFDFNYGFLYLFTDMRHAHIYTRFKQGGSAYFSLILFHLSEVWEGGSLVCCRLAKPASYVYVYQASR